MLNKFKIEECDLNTGMRIVEKDGCEGIVFKNVLTAYPDTPTALVLYNKQTSWNRLHVENIRKVYIPNHPYAISAFYGFDHETDDNHSIGFTLYWERKSEEELKERALYEKLKAKYEPLYET